MVQLDHDEETGPKHGMYGTLEAEVEVEYTIKIFCFLKKALGPNMVHADSKGIIHGLWKGEMKCIGPKF